MSLTSSPKLIIQTAAIISLIFTPFNFDALIIPKLTILFGLALYLLPSLLFNISLFIQDRKLVFLLIIVILIVVQMFLVAIFSEAPLEQEFYGRTGRGLGFATAIGVLIILLYMSITARASTSNTIVKYMAISGVISSIYALLQRFNLDVFNWSSKTNGVIGTLGNPNFQSSFTAMVLIPTLVYFWNKSFRYLFTFISLLLLLATVYYTESTQGYILAIAALFIFISLKIFYQSRVFFYALLLFGFSLGIIALAGMLNKGPLANYLYKISVQSRGDFWRSAFETANSNLFFGVGLDSFGDSYLIYRDKVAVQHSFAEMTDNAHNYLLEYAATGGYPYLILNLFIIILTLYSFYSYQRKCRKFEPIIVSLFCAWVVFQMQSIISPGSITLIVWNSILSGVFISLNAQSKVVNKNFKIEFKNPVFKVKFFSFVLVLTAFVAMWPLISSDRQLKKGVESRNASQVMSSLTSFPESTVKYNLFIQELLKSNLPKQALEMSRAAVEFNQNAVSGWALIFVNPEAPPAERLKAKEEILRLDPLNTEVFKYDIS